MKSFLHSKIHVKKYGGKPDDYADIDDFIDSTKAAVADVRHRAVLHSAFGCFLVERIFGRTRINSDGKEYSPRDVAEDHIQQDLGFIPTMEQYLNNMTVQPWMSGTEKKNTGPSVRHIALGPKYIDLYECTAQFQSKDPHMDALQSVWIDFVKQQSYTQRS